MPFINTHRVGYELIPEEVFDEIGMAMIGKKETGGSKVVHDRRFKATFGCLPKSCSDLWRLILTSNNENFMVEVFMVDNFTIKEFIVEKFMVVLLPRGVFLFLLHCRPFPC